MVTLNYNVDIEYSNTRIVHVDHLIKRVPDVTSPMVEVPADITNVSISSECKAVPVLEESKGLSVTQQDLQEDTKPAAGLRDSCRTISYGAKESASSDKLQY